MDSDYIRIGGPHRRTLSHLRAGAIAGVLMLAGSAAGWTASGIARETPAPTAAAASADTPRVTAGYAPLVDKIAPSIVTVRAERRVTVASQRIPDDPWFREFFGDRFGPWMPERREGGLGSGVIVRSDGYVLTNHHVVADADRVDVELNDGRTVSAKVVGSDAPSDLAVLKIDRNNLPALPLGDSDQVRVGDVVLAFGNPLGVGQAVTQGIVSAKGRATGGSGDGGFEDFIQTDASINRGNSGGALVNMNGELVGINSQILSPTGGNIGIGFAIPANMARNVMTQLIESGTVRRGRLGVTVQTVTSDIAGSLGLNEVRGAIVSAVEADSPAARAGVRRGDVIVSVNGDAVRDSNALRNEIAQMSPGTAATLAILRDGRDQTLTATVGERDSGRRERNDKSTDSDGGGFGLALEPLTPETARQLGVRAGTGLVVSSVRASSRAADAGIRAGDVIEEVDGVKVATVEALRAALSKGSRPALVLLHRGPSALFVTIERTSR